MLASKFIAIDHEAETFTAVVLDEDNEEGKIISNSSVRIIAKK